MQMRQNNDLHKLATYKNDIQLTRDCNQCCTDKQHGTANVALKNNRVKGQSYQAQLTKM